MISPQSAQPNFLFQTRVLKESQECQIREDLDVELGNDHITNNVIGDLGGYSSGTHAAATIAGSHTDLKIAVAEESRFLAGDRREHAAVVMQVGEPLSAPAGDRVVTNSWGVEDRSASGLRQIFEKTAFSLGHAVQPSGFILAR